MANYRWGAYTPNFMPPAPLIGRDGSTAWYLGGDGGFECCLDNVRSVWTFGDTYYGTSNAFLRHVGVSVGSTIAIVSCQNDNITMTHYHGGTSTKVLPFFDDQYNQTNNCRFSAQKPFTFNGKLYVLLVRILNDGIHFIPCGSLIARVNNPIQSPTQWMIDYLTLTTDTTVSFGTECFIYKTSLVLYGALLDGRIITCLLPTSALEATPNGGNVFAKAVPSYLGIDFQWHTTSSLQGVNWYDCQIPTTAGFSCRFNSAIECWQCVLTNTTVSGGFPPYASIMISSQPYGPWSEQRILGYFPEMAPKNPLFNKDNAVYACKEVTDFCSNPGTDVTIAYTNASRSAMPPAGDETRQLSDLTCYINKIARFRNPFV